MTGERPIVLLFCRPYLVADFRTNFAPLSDRYDFRNLTDGHHPGTDDTREAFYRHMKAGTKSAALTDEDRAEIARRCRLLRNIDPGQASRLVEAMACALTEWLDRLRPQAVICHIVDEYVTQTLSMLARKRGIRFVGYAYSFFPNLVQAFEHEYGRAYDVREASVEEAREVIATLSQATYRQDYGQRTNYSLRQHLKGMARYQVKRAVFWAKALREKDPWNVHYAITPFIVERRRLADFPADRDFETDWKLPVERARAAGRRVLYLPLGYFPESTIDYWTPNTDIIDYEDRAVEIAATFASAATLVVKEHPHMMGARKRSFYRRLRAIENVVLAHPLDYSSEVLQRCDAIVLGAGSGGIEAVLRGKPVFSYVSTSYWFEPSGAFYLDLATIPDWPRLVADGIEAHRPLNDGEKERFIKRCLASTMRQRPGRKRWPLCDIRDLDRLLSRAVEAVKPVEVL
jgi:hypothetical protein